MTNSTALKFKKSFLFLFLFLSIVCSSFGQQDSTVVEKKRGRYYVDYINNYETKARGLAIIPEVHGFNYTTIGLSIAEEYSYTNGWVADKSFFQLGAEYIPKYKIIVPKIKYWRSIWVGGIGLNGGANSLYYIKKDASSFALRPEVGINILWFQLNYGYTFLFNNKFEELNPHTFILSCYFPIIW